MNSRGLRSGGLFFEGLRGLIHVTSRGFALWGFCFEGLRALILVNSVGFAVWSFMFRKPSGSNPREFTEVCALELYVSKALGA